MRAVGIIPARGGSKRLPNKNLALLAGQPVIAYTCQAAVASDALDAVYCNTDSSAIAEAARQYGVDTPALRPAELATDQAPVRQAVSWMLRLLAEQDQTFDVVVLLQPTSPLRTAEDIRRAMKLYQQHSPCAVLGVTEAHPPIEWHRRCDEVGQLTLIVTQEARGGRECRLNGAIYIHAADGYLQARTPEREIGYWMPRARSVDIDQAEDLAVAEFHLQAKQGNA